MTLNETEVTLQWNKGFASSSCSDIQPILTYLCETWLSTHGKQEKLLGFEIKILEKIYGPPDWYILIT